MEKKAYWEHFPHKADIGVRGIGPTREEAFAQAALAMTAIVTDPSRIEPKIPVTLEVEAPDDELLLVEWLNALISEMDVRGMLFSRFEIHIDDHHLKATAWGEPLDQEKHRPEVEVKGATYTELKVEHRDGLWIAQCVVDV